MDHIAEAEDLARLCPVIQGSQDPYPEASGEAGSELVTTPAPPSTLVPPADPDPEAGPHSNSRSNKRKRDESNDIVEYDRYHYVLQKPTNLGGGLFKCNNYVPYGDSIFECGQKIQEKNWARHEWDSHKQFVEGKNCFTCMTERCPQQWKVFKRKDKFKEHCMTHATRAMGL